MLIHDCSLNNGNFGNNLPAKKNQKPIPQRLATTEHRGEP